MKSMTGYGISRLATRDYHIEVVVQSYNSKYFELRVHTAPFYNSLEGEFRKELQKKFHRGHVNLSITRSPSLPVKERKIQWNKKQALQWKKIYGQMAKDLKVKNNLDLLSLVSQPGVVDVISQPISISNTEKIKLRALLDKSIELCVKERVREGQALKKDFQKNLKALSISLQKVKVLSEKQNKKLLKNKASEITPVFDEKKSGYENTNSFRMDTSEEISRMTEHIKSFRKLISSGEEVLGKKMSFYLQEMVREMNTVGSKSQDFELTKEVVQSKSTIERMREQVQNVE